MYIFNQSFLNTNTMKKLLFLSLFILNWFFQLSSQVIWSNDFSHPADWIISNEVGNFDNWVIGNNVPSGSFPITSINSTTSSNGYALFDSDLLCSGNQIANISIANPIDLSGFDAVAVRFEQQYRKFCDSTFVIVSIDNGATWTKFPTNIGLANNDETNNPTLTQVTISNVAGGQSNVLIGFQFWSPISFIDPPFSSPGCGYAWMVDDVSIIPAPNAVTGIVFYDANGNSIKDSEDHLLHNVDVYSTNMHSITNNSGVYFLEPAQGELISIQLPNGFNTVTNSFTADFSILNGELDTINFPLTSGTPFNDLSLDIFSTVNFVPGFEYEIVALIQNSSNNPQSGTLTLNIPSSLIVNNISDPNVIINGNTATYSFTNLDVFSTLSITFYGTVDVLPNITIGENVNIQGHVENTLLDVTPSNNFSEINSIIVGSFDPNDKIMTRGETVTPSSIQSGEWFTYRIRFQNTGNFPATFIAVRDTLDAHLDWSTFETLSTSHNVNVSRNSDGSIEWYFPNIMLPCDSVDEAGSHGYIYYRVRPHTNLQLGEQVQNQAFIYFDYNPAIITNIAITEVALPLGLDEASRAYNMQAIPNPTNGFVKLVLSDKTSGNAIVSVYNNSGILVQKSNYTCIQGYFNLDLSGLTSGIYSIQTIVENRIFNCRIIKE